MIANETDLRNFLSFNQKVEAISFGCLEESLTILRNGLLALRQSGYSMTIRRIMIDKCPVSQEIIDLLLDMKFPCLKKLVLRKKKNI